MRFRFVIPAALLVAAAYAKVRREAAAPRAAQARVCDLPEDVRVRAEAEAADAFALAGEGSDAGSDPGWRARPRSPDGRPPVAVPQERRRDAAQAPAPQVVAQAATETAATVAPPRPAPPWSAGWDAPEFPFTAARPARRALREATGAGRDLAAVAEWSVVPAGPAETPAAAAHEETDPDPGPIGEWVAPVAATATAAPPGAPGPSVRVRVDEEGRFSLGGWAAQAGHMVLCGITFRGRHDRPLTPGDIRLVSDGLANVAEGGVVVLGDAGFAPDAEGFTLLVAAAGPGAFAATGRYEVLSA